MWRKIGEISLRTGEIMEVYMVRTPDPHYGRDIVSFLSMSIPNEELWLWHLNLAIHGELDELESRFYIGLLTNRIISNVTTWKYGAIGIVGHLFTVEEHRRKGACTGLMKAVIQDFRKHDGKILIGGFRETSYPIAKNLGFKSIVDHCEVMHCYLDPHFESEYFRTKNVFCRDSMWKDWPGIGLLFGIREGEYLRSIKHKIFGNFDYEEHFLEDMRERLKGLCISKVLTSEKGSIVGYATLTYKHELKDNFWLLDFFVHPENMSYADNIFDAMGFPTGKIRCYVDSKAEEKHVLLLKRGFKKKTRKQITHYGKTLDITLMEL
jgi:hypothetical protein